MKNFTDRRTVLSVVGSLLLILATARPVTAADPEMLFNGSDLDQFEIQNESWELDQDGLLVSKLREHKLPNGTVVMRGKGYIWTRKDYGDFELTVSYRLSAAANSGVFFRADPDNPVQGGFEIQWLDNAGFQKIKKAKSVRNLNAALYDAQPAGQDASVPAGQWNEMKLTCRGSSIRVELNGQLVNQVDLDRWDTAGTNPEGSPNKFQTALRDLPRTGRIGFQNHGHRVWIRRVTIVGL